MFIYDACQFSLDKSSLPIELNDLLFIVLCSCPTCVPDWLSFNVNLLSFHKACLMSTNWRRRADKSDNKSQFRDKVAQVVPDIVLCLMLQRGPRRGTTQLTYPKFTHIYPTLNKIALLTAAGHVYYVQPARM